MKFNYTTALVLSFFSGISVLVLSFFVGKSNLFLLLNGNGGIYLDSFFKWLTHAGEELLWILFFFFLLLKKKQYLPIYFSNLVISTFLVQICKRVLLPNSARPVELLAEKAAEIHTVIGVNVHHWGSFPSGHTSSAFTLWLMICYIFPSRITIFIGFLLALGVGYSRIYLAQHFPIDVGAGMIIAAFTGFCSFYIQSYFDNKQALKSTS